MCFSDSFFQQTIAGTVIVNKATRDGYLAAATSLLATKDISSKDMFNGPPNPYQLTTFQTLNCTFVEPNLEEKPIGGTTPKFYCRFNYRGEDVDVKIKYDQQYNSVNDWGRGNEEVRIN